MFRKHESVGSNPIASSIMGDRRIAAPTSSVGLRVMPERFKPKSPNHADVVHVDVRLPCKKNESRFDSYRQLHVCWYSSDGRAPAL